MGGVSPWWWAVAAALTAAGLALPLDAVTGWCCPPSGSGPYFPLLALLLLGAPFLAAGARRRLTT
ncbi:hypothetical protein M2168_002616 [Streptomyces sp. CZ24]|uniref:hypothetical protein n=1 Tax=Streptomyces TaxID=1883 RepID=UPI000645D4D2|nr:MULTISPECIES: hypothetical protein [unclassified Streptomyces]MCK2141799.1 hypothetical protein [Streptomyces sp. WAC00276]MDH6189584.1 hypothetical protein [Streptomyces sp. CZ24]